MEPVAPVNVPIETHLLVGCCREADRANVVSRGLDQLRTVLPDSFHSHLIALAEEIRVSGRLMRGLADRSQMHIGRVPFMTSYLNVLLPCLCRSLDDITAYYEDKTLSREIRWRKMYNKMTEEAGGLPLPQRFVLYNHFLSLLKQLLTRYTPYLPASPFAFPTQTYSDGESGPRSSTSTRWKRSERGLLPCASRGEFVSASSWDR